MKIEWIDYKKYHIVIASFLLFAFLSSNLFSATLSGKVQYTDKIYNTNGFTGKTVLREVRAVEIEVIRADNLQAVASGFTDENGNYLLTGLPQGTSLKIRIYARRLNHPKMNFKVMNLDKAVYTTVTPSFTLVSNSEEYNVTIPVESSGPFNIFDVVELCFQYLYEPTGINGLTLSNPLPSPPPLLSILWEAGYKPGTGFISSSNEIYLNGVSTDTDEFDDDIIMHEFGHYAAYNFAKDDTPGGSHSITGHYELTLTWSEGWAHYFSSSCRHWVHNVFKVGQNRYPYYVYSIDTKGTIATSFEVETPQPYMTGADNELAVAAVLWDVLKATSYNYRNVFNVYHDNMTNDKRLPNRTILERFHDNAINNIITELSMQAILSNVGIRYEKDVHEPSNTVEQAIDLTGISITQGNPASVADLTFYPAERFVNQKPSVDRDIFKFNARGGCRYQLETYNLKDGADSVLYLYDPNFSTVLAENDDVSESNKASKITWTCPSTGVYYAVAEPYSETDTINTYGTYSFKISLVEEGQAPSISSFTAEPTEGVFPLSVNFSVSATSPNGNIASYKWDFDGDGVFDKTVNTSANTNTQGFTYSSVGTYTCKVRATDNYGIYDEKTIKISVTQGNLPLQISKISVSPSSSTMLPATVNVSANISSNNLIDNIYVDCNNDGSPEGTYKNIGEQAIKLETQCNYSSPGVYTISVKAYDKANYSTTAYAFFTAGSTNEEKSLLYFPVGYLNDSVKPTEAQGNQNFYFNICYYSNLGNSPNQIQVWIDLNDNSSFETSEKIQMLLQEFNSPLCPIGNLYSLTKKISFSGSKTPLSTKFRFFAKDASGRITGNGNTKMLNGIEIGPTDNQTLKILNNIPTLAFPGTNYPGFGTDGVNPDSGSIGTIFTFKVRYTDLDNQEPKLALLWLDRNNDGKQQINELYPMLRGTGIGSDADGLLSNGEIYYTQVEIDNVINNQTSINYQFIFSDGVIEPDKEIPYDAGVAKLSSPNPITLSTGGNSPPQLSYLGSTGYETDGVQPNSGNSGSTFTFKVKYTDAENSAPVKKEVWLDLNGDNQFDVNEIFEMSKDTEEPTNDNDYSNGEIFKMSMTLYKPANGNSISGEFHFSDGSNETILPLGVIITISGSTDSDGDNVDDAFETLYETNNNPKKIAFPTAVNYGAIEKISVDKGQIKFLANDTFEMLQVKNPGISLPNINGVFLFGITDIEVDTDSNPTVQVTLELPSILPQGVKLYKLANYIWREINYIREIDTRISFEITDNDELDCDASVGKIRDPFGLFLPFETNESNVGGGGGGGCFIATAVYGSYNAPEVMVLRRFRDEILLQNEFGKLLVATYYKISPPLAYFIKNNQNLKLIARLALQPLVLEIAKTFNKMSKVY